MDLFQIAEVCVSVSCFVRARVSESVCVFVCVRLCACICVCVCAFVEGSMI